MSNKRKTDKRTKKKQQENPTKTPDKKKLLQLSFQKVPDFIRDALLSDKTARKKRKRTDSSDTDFPLGASPRVPDISIDLKSIHK